MTGDLETVREKEGAFQTTQLMGATGRSPSNLVLRLMLIAGSQIALEIGEGEMST